MFRDNMGRIDWMSVFFFLLVICIILGLAMFLGNFFKLWCVDLGIFGKSCGISGPGGRLL